MPEPKHILCIEDNLSNAELFRRMLTSGGYEVYVAATGGRGLEYARENPVDLILLDINLPGMTGFEVLKQIRNIDFLSKIPVIAVTANSINASKKACLEAGFDGYVNKPIMRNELREIIAKFLAD
jgi:CheY-like chemotaxis protein